MSFIIRVHCDGEVYREGDVEESVTFGCFDIRTVECCGWVEVSGFPYLGCYEEGEAMMFLRQFEDISNNMEVEFAERWADTYDNPQHFPMFCVLTDQQLGEWEEHLDRLGWVKGIRWRNPNTGNVCNSFTKVPLNCKV